MKLFLTSQANMVLDKIVSMIDKPASQLSVVFIPTAGNPYGEDKPWMDADRDKLDELGFKVMDFDIDGKSEDDVREKLSEADVIFVAGGNAFYLLEKMRNSGTDKVINELKGSDKIYIGSSAGSCIAGPDIESLAAFDDPSKAQLKSSKALGLVDFVVLPHAGKDKYAPIQGKILKDFSDKYKIIQITDTEMLDKNGDKY
ncbi:MAG: Type 1 glutamine amidotransferase-like domain-containing protein [bacterium]